MTRKNLRWFLVAGGCFALAVLIFGGRSLLLDWLGESSVYRVVIFSAWVFLAAGAGALTRGLTDRGSDGEEPTGAVPGSAP
ncbi:hypothetical protein PTW37_00850 [Arthrobacter agilis]|uniref:hypothetical protein n=1 Tax=Arthrobacter agilis TaxID=37921 RepID=UPI0023665116|nr:hypothetical protein [Arthrobacter agilis]WDF33520.1 hypothetical protein PTW37_00850 [Arthrobacter agilis]